MFKLVRKLLPIGIKLIIVRYISNDITGWMISKIYKNKIPHKGILIHTDFDRIQRKTVADIYFEIYERAEIDQVITYLDPEVDVVELGASIGVNSLHIRRCLSRDRKLLVVEADPGLVDILRYNIKENGMENEVMVANYAIDYSGNEYVNFNINKSNLSGHVLDESDDVHTAAEVNVKATTLSGLLEQYEYDQYTLVSDIEGMEIPVFIEDKAALKNCQQIFLEIDGISYKNIDYSVDDIVDMICNCGFTVVERYYNCVVFSR